MKIFFRKNEKLPTFDTCTYPSFLIHSPFELPASYDKNQVFTFGYGFDIQVMIKPEIIRTDESLRSLEADKRGCYFEGEKKLEYFKVYTKKNCELECFSEILRNHKTLNCTAYYAVRDQEMEICDYRREWAVQLRHYYVLRNKSQCHCLDECNSVRYNVEVISQLVKSRETSIEFVFKDIDIVPLMRYMPLTFSVFLAQSGGLMGLFAGISVLSIFELFYFATLRWIVNVWRSCRK